MAKREPIRKYQDVPGGATLGSGRVGSAGMSGEYLRRDGTTPLTGDWDACDWTIKVKYVDIKSSGSYKYNTAHILSAPATGNLCIGYAGQSLSTGDYNTLAGYEAGATGTTMGYATHIGYQAGYAEATGNNYNVSAGYQAAYNNQTGQYNVCVGYWAGKGASTKSFDKNTYVGGAAGGACQTGYENVGVGWQAGGGITDGYYAVAIGGRALLGMTTGHDCVAVGYYAMQSCANGVTDSIAIGSRALCNVTGNNNTAIGHYAGLDATSGTNNVAVGHTAMEEGTRGSSNTYIGANSGVSSDSATDDNNNSGLGYNSLAHITTGDDNVAVGYQCLDSVTTGSDNVAAGSGAGGSITTQNGGVFLGYQAGANCTTANRLYIDNSNTATPLIYGEFDNDIVMVYGTFKAGAASNYAQFAGDGELTLTGTARVYKYVWCPASGLQAPGLKPATAVTRTVGMAWEFSDGQEEEIRGNIKIPDDIDTSVTVTFCLGWSSPTASQDCDWEISYLLTAANEDTDGAADATIQDYVSSSGTNDGLVVTEFTSDAFSVGASDVCLHFTIMRDGNDGSDNLGAAAHVHGIALKYTANKLGVAT